MLHATGSTLRAFPMHCPTPLRLALLLPVLLFAACHHRTTAEPTALNVRDFGAVGDGIVKDTAAIQAALDACGGAGGGEVLVPAGTYLIGSIELKANTTLRLAENSTLAGSPDLADYPVVKARWEGLWVDAHRALISARQADHIALIGPGLIAASQLLGGRAMPRRPCVIEPIECNEVRLEGFLISQRLMGTIHPTYCDHVTIRNVTIRSIGANSDGVDVDSCRHVFIEGCDISSGDECISLKSGRGLEGLRAARPTEDVTIRNCTLADANFACIGVGSETSGGIRGLRIEHCTFTAAETYALYIKSRPGRGAAIEDITAEDLDVRTAPGGFLRINLLNGGLQDADPVPGPEGIPAAKNYRFNNIKVNCGTLVDAGSIPAEKPLDGLALTNITGLCAKGVTLAHVRGAELREINVIGLAGPLLTTTDVEVRSAVEDPAVAAAPAAPATPADPATPPPGATILWNGRDLDGWQLYPADSIGETHSSWSAADNVLSLHSKVSGYLKTVQSYADYHLHIEWRWPKEAPENTNSGVLIHLNGPDAVWPACFECQLKAGNAGQFVGLGLDVPDAPLLNNRKRAPRLADPSEKPLGEWNAYDIHARGDTVELFVNGVRQNYVTKLPVAAGAIALQLEGFPVEFRNVWLEPAK